jgi:hypothetical protein
MAARAPEMNIFSQSFVLRDDAGWQITAAGLEFLAVLQSPASSVLPTIEQEPVLAPTTPISPAVPLIGLKRSRRERRRRRARSAASGGVSLAASRADG